MEVGIGTIAESVEASEIAAESAPFSFDPDKLVERDEQADRRTDVASFDPDRLVEARGGSGVEPDGPGRHGETGLESVQSELPETHALGRVYVDDNNQVYRVGDSLVHNSTYEINGYTYQTDDLGRIVSAEGTVRLKDEGRKKLYIKDSMDAIGKGSERDTDDRGHIIADQFEGANGLENIVPMDSELNKGDFRKLENRLADAVKDGSNVSYKVEPRYSDGSHRPSEFVVTDVIDGETTVTVFKNERKTSSEQ